MDMSLHDFSHEIETSYRYLDEGTRLDEISISEIWNKLGTLTSFHMNRLIFGSNPEEIKQSKLASAACQQFDSELHVLPNFSLSHFATPTHIVVKEGEKNIANPSHVVSEIVIHRYIHFLSKMSEITESTKGVSREKKVENLKPGR